MPLFQGTWVESALLWEVCQDPSCQAITIETHLVWMTGKQQEALMGKELRSETEGKKIKWEKVEDMNL